MVRGRFGGIGRPSLMFSFVRSQGSSFQQSLRDRAVFAAEVAAKTDEELAVDYRRAYQELFDSTVALT